MSNYKLTGLLFINIWKNLSCGAANKSTCMLCCVNFYLLFGAQARVDSVSPSKSSSHAISSDTKPKKDPSPKKSPVKTSSKLAQMKRRQEEVEEQREKDRGEKQIKISPKKEPISPTSSERAATPKTSVSTGMTKSRNFSTPKSDSAPNKISPTKPEVYHLNMLLN